MALSAAYRTGQRFGASYLTDVLLGKSDDRIKRFRHDTLNVYGIGKEHDANTWRSVFRQLIARSLLTTDMERKGGLRLTEISRPVLTGSEQLFFRVDEKPAKQKRTRSGKSVAPEDNNLWEELRITRSDIAKEQGVPAYVIFHDATLMEMVQNKPRTLDAMAAISGVGAAKLKKYGQQFLEVIVEASNSEEDAPDPEVIREQLLAEISKGTPIAEIGKNCNLSASQSDAALVALARDGELSLERITSAMSEDECGEVESEILFALETGEQSLKSVSERLGGKYSMPLLRMMQAAIRTEVGVE